MATPEHQDRSQRFAVPEGADPKAANADSVTFIPPPKSAIPTTRDVLRAGLVTGITAAIVCWGLAVIAWVFHTAFRLSNPFASGDSGEELVHLPWIAVLLVPLLAGVVGSFAAAGLLGVRRARKYVLVFGSLIAGVSVLFILLQPDTVTWPTKIWLILMIAVAWLIIVPQVARVVGDSDPVITASYRDDADTDLR